MRGVRGWGNAVEALHLKRREREEGEGREAASKHAKYARVCGEKRGGGGVKGERHVVIGESCGGRLEGKDFSINTHEHICVTLWQEVE